MSEYAQAMLDQGMLDFAARAVHNALSVKPDYPLAQALLSGRIVPGKKLLLGADSNGLTMTQ